MMIHQVAYMVYVTPHSTHFPLMWLKPNHLHQISFSSHREIYIGSLKLEHRYPLIIPACLQSVCGLYCKTFPTKQSFNDGSLSFEHIHPYRVVCAQLTSILEQGMCFWSFAKPRKKVFYSSSSKRAHAIQHALMHHSKYLMSK
jgi:hypothetical protein